MPPALEDVPGGIDGPAFTTGTPRSGSAVMEAAWGSVPPAKAVSVPVPVSADALPRSADGDQIEQFARALFRYAGVGTVVSLRSFRDDANELFGAHVPVLLGDDDLARLIAAAVKKAGEAAKEVRPVVFCPPIATFSPPEGEPNRAREQDLAEGLALSVECDSAPGAARARLAELLGPPTVVVESGGVTSEGDARLHLHWRLNEPTDGRDDHVRLKEARALATAVVGGDASNVPIVHPIRWPGSWHCKKEPRLARIVELNDGAEIDLTEALEILREAAPAKTSRTIPTASDRPASAPAEAHGHRSDSDLIAAIQSGAELHVPLVSMAARLIGGGLLAGSVVKHLRALMEAMPEDRRDERWQARFDDIPRTVKSAEDKFAKPDAEPVDLWARYDPPALPYELLPPVLEHFVRVRSEMMGVDPGGLAMAALTTCAASVPDRVKLQVKRNDAEWKESARMWTGLVGPPSTKKSPILGPATAPLKRIDTRLFKEWKAAMEVYLMLSKEEQKKMRPPKMVRLRIEDITIEQLQEVLKDSPDGILCVQDELGGWFASMEKYSGGRGAGKDRAAYLQTFNGGEYAVNRVGRGNFLIPNFSMSLLGGIQPEVIRKVVGDSQDDGLIQRMFPIVLPPGLPDRDEPAPDVDTAYGLLIERLHLLRPPGLPPGSHMDFSKPLLPSSPVLRFDDGAQALRRQLADRHHALMSIETVNKKLASHIGKYDGMFARLCVLWHCIENVEEDALPILVTEATAGRVAAFLHDFLLPHAVAFYAGVLGLSDEHDMLVKVADYILAHGLEEVTGRDVARGDRAMRGMDRHQTQKLLEQLEAFGWLDAIPAPRNGSAQRWAVNPAVHKRFAEQRRRGVERRQQAREMIAGIGRAAPA